MTRLQCARVLSFSLSLSSAQGRQNRTRRGPWKWRAEAPEAIPTPIIPPVSSAPARSRQLARNWEGPGHSRDQSLLHSCLQWLSRSCDSYLRPCYYSSPNYDQSPPLSLSLYSSFVVENLLPRRKLCTLNFYKLRTFLHHYLTSCLPLRSLFLSLSIHILASKKIIFDILNL